MRITSRPDISWARTVNSGAVSPMTQLKESSRMIRMTSANPSPSRRASACLSSGSLSTRIEINTMLSMPRTISRASNVKKATQISGFSNISTLATSRFCYESWARSSLRPATALRLWRFMPTKTLEEPQAEPYSPECVEEVFAEVPRMLQYVARITNARGFFSASPGGPPREENDAYHQAIPFEALGGGGRRGSLGCPGRLARVGARRGHTRDTGSARVGLRREPVRAR